MESLLPQHPRDHPANLMMRKSVLCILMAMHVQAFAGSPGGPYVIWVNLSQNKTVDQFIEQQLDKGEDCGRPSLVVTTLPEGIATDLVSRGFLKSDKNAILSLDRQMRTPVAGEADEGFDGILVYDEVNGPRISGLTRGWKKVLRLKIARPADKNEHWSAFCTSIPPITRPT